MLLGIDTNTLLLWEKNRSTPLPRYYPKIVDFLKFCPLEQITTFGEKLRITRTYMGLTQEEAARLWRIDPSTWASYENGRTIPSDRRQSQLAQTRASK